VASAEADVLSGLLARLPEALSPAPAAAAPATRVLGRVAILYPCDPLGHVPSGIDSFVRGVLRFAPDDLSITLIGASSDLEARPLGEMCRVTLGDREFQFLPITHTDPRAVRSRIPLIARFTLALRKARDAGVLDDFDVLDFHKMEPLILFGGDPRAKNLVMHQDYSGVIAPNSEIFWHRMPAVYAWLERRVLPRLSRMFSVRNSSVTAYGERFPKLRDRLEFLPTWVDTDFFQPAWSADARATLRERFATETGADNAGDWLVFLGRLDLAKDPMLALQAHAEVVKTRPNAHLHYIGDGVLRQNLEAERTRLGLDARVTFHGARPATYIRDMLQAADTFVLSSSYEGMPFAVLEALACGLPVAARNVGEVPLVVRDSHNGRLCMEHTPAALAAAIGQVLDHREFLRGNTVAAIERFTARAVLSRLYDQHREQIAARRAA
jgi:glycosyltransferase involved in cell wall biosynthesis